MGNQLSTAQHSLGPGCKGDSLRAKQKARRPLVRADMCVWTRTLAFLCTEAHHWHTHKDGAQVAGGRDRKVRLLPPESAPSPTAQGKAQPTGTVHQRA